MRQAMKLGLVLPAMLTMGGFVRAADSTAVTATKDQPHVMQQLLDIASQREKEIQNTIRDYTCIIVKRERIKGVMQENRFIQAKVRTSSMIDGQKQPLSVHLTFGAPTQVKGREVIYVEGQNNNEMIVRRGGSRFEYVTTNVALDSDLARTETLMQIGHLGFDGMVSEIVKHLRSDIAADPTSSNTQVRLSREAKINDRMCTSVVITHPLRADGLTYHRAEFFVDNEYHLPVRVAAYDWPTSEGAEPELLAEFTYTKIKINVGLTDADFDAETLRTAAR